MVSFKKIINKLNIIIPFSLTEFIVKAFFTKSKIVSAVRPYFTQKGMKEFWKKFSNDESKKSKVIIYGLRTFATHHQAVFEKVFSDLFRFYGANVKNLICNSVLPSCDGATKGFPDWVLCRNCRNQRKAHFNNFPNDFITFNQFISKKEISEIKKEVDNLTDGQLENHKYMGVNVGRHALDSVSFAFQFSFDNRNKLHLKKNRDSIFRGMITVRVAKNLLEIERPTHIFTLHGCYASWGPFSEYLSKNGVIVYVHRGLLNPGIGYFDFPIWTEDVNDIPAKGLWERRRNEPLTNKQKQQINIYLKKKRQGKSDDYTIYYEQKKYKDNKFSKLLSSDKKKYVLYMHSLWDRGFEEAKSDCFDNQINWLRQTIEYFKKNNNSYLFIKPHPAEYSIFEQRRNSGVDVILSLFSDLPENILILGKDLPCTSYDLMDRGCIGITYYGTVGLEHSFFKKPVLVGGNIHYTKVGAAYKISTRDEYFCLLDNPEPLYKYPVDNYELIEKYAYHYYFASSILIPFYKRDRWWGHCIDWNVLENYEDFIANDKITGHIARSILNKRDVVNPE